ncbi:MAG: hypothetical protein JSS32_03370 [Verrucomicrobia bacterium]|nr:hypothetical protein [Verrucomicrobiota bacterium]
MFWDKHSDWKTAETAWDRKAEELRASHPLKVLGKLPKMAGIAEPGIKRKGLVYLLSHDRKLFFWRHFFRSPIRYAYRLIRSYLRGKSYTRDGDFFLYGLSSEEDLKLAPDSLFILGFSYCHKPFECPSGRFTDQCIRDPEHPVCRQCFIGKCAHAAPKETRLLWIPTIHYIGEKIFEAAAKNPKQKIFFLITACEMSLEMFGDWGNMVGIEGIGVRLDGRICNTMKAFELSERGVKPGLTVVLDETQKRMLDLLRRLRS